MASIDKRRTRIQERAEKQAKQKIKQAANQQLEIRKRKRKER
jgi:hypothetical protein